MIRIVQSFPNSEQLTQILCAEWSIAEDLMRLIHQEAQRQQTPFAGVFVDTEIVNYGFEPGTLCMLTVRWEIIGHFGFKDVRESVLNGALWALYTKTTDGLPLAVSSIDNIGVLRVPDKSGTVRDVRVNDVFTASGLPNAFNWLNHSRLFVAGVCEGPPTDVFVFQKQPFAGGFMFPDMASQPGLVGYQFRVFFGLCRHKLEDVSLLFAYWLHPEAKNEG